jgi:hypothetical protein
MKPDRPTIVLKLESIRGDSIKNLRFILKRLGRTYGFRCLSAIEIPADVQEQPPGYSGGK